MLRGNTMKIALVDDEIIQLQNLRQLLAAELSSLLPHSTHQIDGYRNGQTLLERWQPALYDVAVLGIVREGD